MKTFVSSKAPVIIFIIIVSLSIAVIIPSYYHKYVLLKLVQASEAGDVDAQFELGNIYLHSKVGIEKNHLQAIKWLRKAASQNHVEAQYELAEIYFYGKHVMKNYQHAAELYMLAAENMHAKSQYRLSLLYGAGSGVDQDSLLAYMWATIAVKAGYARAEITRRLIIEQITKGQHEFANLLVKKCERLEHKGCGYSDYRLRKTAN